MKNILSIAMAMSLTGPPATAEWRNFIEDVTFKGEAYYSVSEATVGDGIIVVRQVHNQQELDVYFITNAKLCGEILAKVDVMIDGVNIEKETLMTLSTSKDAVFFTNNSDWIQRLNEGRKMHFRATDTCQEKVQFEFDIGGRTGFN